MEKKKEYTQLLDEFSVRDALGGYLSGMYEKDRAILNQAGFDCTEILYSEAYSNTMNP